MQILCKSYERESKSNEFQCKSYANPMRSNANPMKSNANPMQILCKSYEIQYKSNEIGVSPIEFVFSDPPFAGYKVRRGTQRTSESKESAVSASKAA